MEELSKPNKIYFKNLDSIRFFAALMVFLRHGMEDSYKYLNIRNAIPGRFLDAISDGGAGVSIFFVLSGFLITYLILSEIKLTGDFSVKNFYVRRILRIWPLYFAVITAAFVFIPSLKSLLHLEVINSGANPWYQYTFLSNFDVIRIKELNPYSMETMQSITWSVAIEEQFYALWPIIFAFLPRKLFLPAVLTVITGSLVFRFFNSHDFVVLYFHTLSVMIYLGTGALFAYLIISKEAVKKFFQQTPSWAIIGSFILFLVSMMYQDVLFPSKIGQLIEPAYFAFLFAYIIASQSMIAQSSKLGLGKIGFANKLGKYTYGMYLLHPTAIMIAQAISVKIFHLRMDSFTPVFMSGILAFVLTILISWASYEYFEKRFLNLKKSFGVIAKE